MPSPATRPPELQRFLELALHSMRAHANSVEARRALAGIAAALPQQAERSPPAALRKPACRHLAAALEAAQTHPGLTALAEGFREVEPLLEWTSGEGPGEEEGYAEVTLLGPGGYEERDDIWLGLSLLAPHFDYPLHRHRPEEVYLALSEGAFYQEDSGWFSPGLAGSFYNRPSIWHAMRAGAQPLLALWALRRVALAPPR